jgi:hypothetical protein
VPHADARVHVEDRGYQFADGVYEVLVLEQGRLLDATLHLDRLERSLAALRITPPIGRAALGQVIGEVAARNRLRSGLIYIQVTRGVARREHAFPRAGTRPALVITMRRLPHFPADVRGRDGDGRRGEFGLDGGRGRGGADTAIGSLDPARLHPRGAARSAGAGGVFAAGRGVFGG